MNRILIVAVLTILGFSDYSNAQEINFGAKAGLNITNLNGGHTEGDHSIGFHLGFISEFIFRRGRFGVQPEFLYSSQGSKARDGYKTTLDYVSVPLLFKFFPIKALSFEAGPQASFLVNDKREFSDDLETETETGAENFDLGVNLGLGYQLKYNLFVQARYHYGIKKVLGDLHNSVFQFSLGYKF
ncbi:porin family protein [Gelidibacter salicanalis]|uniref:PorT family protein n=1 Tax=Gelidibacter salicanalis TaxID=291193 RepID=A0A934NIG9_9FLAO|nr:porin family protein [Gelidibacter salicanalis]MBJ7880079.1 PorT family protein [Gelidibacter salicanalis]